MFKFSWTREWKETIEKGRDLKKKKKPQYLGRKTQRTTSKLYVD